MKNLFRYKIFEAYKLSQKMLNTRLINAAKSGNLINIDKYLHQGADINTQNEDGRSVLMVAIENDHSSAMEYLVKVGANLNIQDRDGRTALINAVTYGHKYDIHFLIEHGIDINIQDNDGWTALIHAAYCDYTTYVKKLILSGADMTLKDKHGFNFIDESSGDRRDWYKEYENQKLILSKEPLLYKSFIKNKIKIDPKIKEEFADIISGQELGIL